MERASVFVVVLGNMPQMFELLYWVFGGNMEVRQPASTVE